MKTRILAAMISLMTMFSGMAVQAAEDVPESGEEAIVTVTEGKTYEAVTLPSRNYTGIVADTSGRCFLYANGKLASTYTGLWNDPVVGWWLVVNGEVAFGYSDFYNDPVVGWWKIAGGQIDFGYTGWYESPSIGTWYVQGGQLDLSKGQKAEDKTTTTIAKDGYSDNTYGVATGVISNDNEACNFIVNSLLTQCVQFDVTCVGGYTYEDFLDVYNALRDIWYFETDYYDLRCNSTWRNWNWVKYSAYGDQHFTMDIVYSDTPAQEQQLDSLAAQMKAKTAGMSDYDKVVCIHDYILSVNTYDYTYAVSSPYGALIGGTSVCHGYALAFQKLAEACGLTSKYLASSDRAHAYNVVLLDGQWYMVDCTWDDGSNNWRNSRNYFLKGISGLRGRSYPYVGSFTNGTYSFVLSATDYVR